MVVFNKSATIAGKELKDADGDAIPAEAFENEPTEKSRKSAKKTVNKESLSDFTKRVDESNGDA